ncbi:MAG: PilN domain-containing protein [Acidobacteriota bacterium]
MIRINLISERKVEKTRKPLVNFGAGNEALGNVILTGVILAALCVCGFKYMSLRSTLGDLSAKITDATVERDRLKEILKKGEEFKAQRQLLRKKVELITQLKLNQSVPVHLLDQISRNLPEFLWLENLSERNDVVSLSGRATTYNAVSNLYNNLRDSRYFADVILGTTQEQSHGVSFSLSCRFVGQPDVAVGKTDGAEDAPAAHGA